jgi:glycerol-3-phosphate dehydrogenase
VERHDFAAGTSSRSSRLVHGGVRYLEHGHLGLVFESSRERRLLLELAPHLVRPLAFTWPVYAGARVPRWKVRAGLALYDALSLFRNVHRHEGLSSTGVLACEPALTSTALKGGARYWDAATDDSRLTLANVLAAHETGAVVANHTAVTGAVRLANGRLAGVAVHDQIGDVQFEVQARVVVNATGPWSDATAALTGETQGTQLLGSAGTHIAVPRSRVGNRDAVTIVSPLDGRVMFALPAGPHTIIGTTERPARRGPDDIRATEAEVTYLLQNVNRLFGDASLTRDDVISAWCGIRPLAVARRGEVNANAASREHAVTHRQDGLVSVTGGKLTTYRAMAADVLTQATREFSASGVAPVPERGARDSRQIPLPGGDFSSRETVAAQAGAVAHDHAVGEHLMRAYGTGWRQVWQYAQNESALAPRIVTDLPYVLAEVRHAVEHEMACTLSDLLVRRTHIAFETRDHGRAVARHIAPLVATYLGWSAAETDQAVARYDADVTRLFSVDAA